MDPKSLKLLADLNCAVIQFRGLYAAWARRHGISYNEMLVFYTIRDQGYCTQKQICDSYLLPRQTINHVILDLRARGLLTLSRAHSAGREKAFVLTEQGREYAAPLLESLDGIETRAIRAFGGENLHALAQTMLAYDRALQSAMETER